MPLVSTLNSDGRIKANAALVAAGSAGAVSVYVTNSTHLVIDLNGYFVPASTSSGLVFYPFGPCRIADTRLGSAPFGMPSLAAGETRTYAIPTSACAVPGTAQAYALNVTAVPHGPLWYLTAFPAGQPLPNISTLNAATGLFTANAAIVNAGNNGAISVYASDSTDLVLDVVGYFAPPQPGGLFFYPVTPCRPVDTRLSGQMGAFTGAVAFDLSAHGCLSSPNVQAVVANNTVVPTTPLGFLTIWPDQQHQPYTSTLNAPDGAITSNMALVQVKDYRIDAFSTGPTNLIVDVIGYLGY